MSGSYNAVKQRIYRESLKDVVVVRRKVLLRLCRRLDTLSVKVDNLKSIVVDLINEE